MVEALWVTLRLVVDTVRVELEALVGGVDGHADGADGGHSLLEGALGSGRDVDEPLVGLTDVAPLEVTGVLVTLIRIRRLCVDSAVGLKNEKSILKIRHMKELAKS